MEDFSFTSNLTKIQNNLIGQAIRDASNLQQLSTEEAVRTVIQSYTDKFSAVKGKVTSLAKLLVKDRELITKEKFNDIFLSLYIDLYSLYKELEIVETVLTLNLQRNKHYFLLLKKRVRDLWNKLYQTRSDVYNPSVKTQSYFESFNTDLSASVLSNVTVDKKSGILSLSAKEKKILNKAYLIKNISSFVYPEHNIAGGVNRTTDILNTYKDNYENGPRDMLRNGLYKEQLICEYVPSVVVNIGDDVQKILKQYKGIVGVVDIEFVYPVEINRIDLDLFGDLPTLVSSILYKIGDGPWNEVIGSDNKGVYSEDFDIVTFMNISRIKVSRLKIVFNQKHYDVLDSSTPIDTLLENTITKDLSERRLDIVKLNREKNENVRTPTDRNTESLYHKLIEIIEKTNSVDNIIDEINNVINPVNKIQKINFKKPLKFELGAWSIDPTIEKYTEHKGIFRSTDYVLNNRSLISTSLSTRYNTPGYTSCNFFVNIDDKKIPISTSEFIRERLTQYTFGDQIMDSWPGSFIKTNFPIDISKMNKFFVYEDGIKRIVDDFIVINSRIIFINGFYTSAQSKYLVEYITPKFSCRNLYVLTKNPGTTITKDISSHVVSSRLDVLSWFLNKLGSNSEYSNKYTIVSAGATEIECAEWFTYRYNKALFISSKVASYDEIFEITLSGICNVGDTKFNNYAINTNNSLISIPPLPMETR